MSSTYSMVLGIEFNEEMGQFEVLGIQSVGHCVEKGSWQVLDLVASKVRKVFGVKLNCRKRFPVEL